MTPLKRQFFTKKASNTNKTENNIGVMHEMMQESFTLFRAKVEHRMEEMTLLIKDEQVKMRHQVEHTT